MEELVRLPSEELVELIRRTDCVLGWSNVRADAIIAALLARKDELSEHVMKSIRETRHATYNGYLEDLLSDRDWPLPATAERQAESELALREMTKKMIRDGELHFR